MTVYLTFINDHHTDTDAEVFTTAEAAIEGARRMAREACRHPEDYEESAIQGWLFHATYSANGDSVWVIAKEVQE